MVWIMAWRRSHYLNQWLSSLLTYICITWPQCGNSINFPIKDYTASWPSYLYNANPYTSSLRDGLYIQTEPWYLQNYVNNADPIRLVCSVCSGRVLSASVPEPDQLINALTPTCELPTLGHNCPTRERRRSLNRQTFHCLSQVSSYWQLYINHIQKQKHSQSWQRLFFDNRSTSSEKIEWTGRRKTKHDINKIYASFMFLSHQLHNVCSLICIYGHTALIHSVIE